MQHPDPVPPATLGPGQRELHLVFAQDRYRLVLHRRDADGRGGTMLYVYPDVMRGSKTIGKRLIDLRARARALAEMTDTPYREDWIVPMDLL